MDAEIIRLLSGAIVLIALLAMKITNAKTNDKNTSN